MISHTPKHVRTARNDVLKQRPAERCEEHCEKLRKNVPKTRSKRTSQKRRTNVAPTSHQRRTNVAPSSHQRRTNVAPNVAPTSHHRRTNVAPTSHQTSQQRRTKRRNNVAPMPGGLWRTGARAIQIPKCLAWATPGPRGHACARKNNSFCGLWRALCGPFCGPRIIFRPCPNHARTTPEPRPNHARTTPEPCLNHPLTTP